MPGIYYVLLPWQAAGTALLLVVVVVEGETEKKGGIETNTLRHSRR